ncbi:uncharacterized protein LOC110250329 [Exaiptasia diaphana]|uniref:Uncharacterized protein n=1 Tax=Exaiptasia diaphana TaxID=2652724 RepID=A0A913Y0G8_EXADI|nr:uncharacterized protein LOC110250329 [Exaiptasia diaphana]
MPCFEIIPFDIQADILHKQHNYDIVVLMFHKHGRGNTVSKFATNGTGSDFFKQKSGICALELFEKFMEASVPLSSPMECTTNSSADIASASTSSSSAICATNPSADIASGSAFAASVQGPK